MSAKWTCFRQLGLHGGTGSRLTVGMQLSWCSLLGGVLLEVGKVAGIALGMAFYAVMVLVWCGLVLVVSGRLPWFARRFF